MEIVIAVIGSGALSALISGMFQLLSARKGRKNGVRDGVRQLLYDRIKFLGRKFIGEGAVKQEDYEDLKVMHGIYHNELDGNGYLDDIMGEVKALPKK